MSKSFFVPFVILCVFAQTNCNAREPETTIVVGGAHEIEARFPDNTVAYGWDEYEKAAATHMPRVADLGEFRVAITDAIGETQTSTAALSIEADPGGVSVKIGAWRATLEPDLSYIHGCIQKRMLHMKIRIDNEKIPAAMIEIHFVGWIDGHTPCLGIMNTGFVGYGWNQCFCFKPDKKILRRTAAQALLSAGMGGGTAAIISAVLIPLVAGAITAIP